MNRSSIYKIFIGGLVWMLSSTSFSWAQSLTSGNNAYASKDYTKAIEIYESLLQEGKTAPELHYNLANAYYMNQELGQSILHYEKALKIQPNYEDAKFNLNIARNQIIDRIEQIPSFFLTAWFGDVYRGTSAGKWSIGALLGIWLSLIAAVTLVILRDPRHKRLSFYVGVTGAIIGIGMLTLSLMRIQTQQEQHEAIVLASNAYVKDAPNGSTDLLLLHEGTKVKLLEQLGEWSQIEISGVAIGEVKGFIKKADIGEI
ncbi:MAG: tetratricopeptide repeat protein [Bacteroidota bacterium]